MSKASKRQMTATINSNWIQKTSGQITREILKRKKLFAPEVKEKIKIKAGLWVYPRVELKTEKQKQDFIEAFKIKYNITQ